MDPGDIVDLDNPSSHKVARVREAIKVVPPIYPNCCGKGPGHRFGGPIECSGSSCLAHARCWAARTNGMSTTRPARGRIRNREYECSVRAGELGRGWTTRRNKWKGQANSAPRRQPDHRRTERSGGGRPWNTRKDSGSRSPGRRRGAPKAGKGNTSRKSGFSRSKPRSGQGDGRAA